MITSPDPATSAVVVGAVVAAAGGLLSTMAQNWGRERREAAKQRRDDDRHARLENERLRIENAQLRSAIGVLQAICISAKLPLPPTAVTVHEEDR